MYLVHPGILSFDRPPKDSSRHCSTHCRSDHRIDKQSIVTLSANWTPLCKLYSSSLRENVIQRLLSASGVFFSNLIFWETNGGWVGCFFFVHIFLFFLVLNPTTPTEHFLLTILRHPLRLSLAERSLIGRLRMFSICFSTSKSRRQYFQVRLPELKNKTRISRFIELSYFNTWYVKQLAFNWSHLQNLLFCNTNILPARIIIPSTVDRTSKRRGKKQSATFENSYE